MYFNGLGTAVPQRRYTQRECWEALRASACYAALNRRAQFILEQVLCGNNGIATRHLALETLAEVFTIDPDVLHRRFLQHAPRLAERAARAALADVGLHTDAIDAVIASTCTGYLCPGISSYLIEGLGLRSEVLAFDLVGQGCGAALPNWQMAEALIAAGRAANVLSVCVEVCSATMYLDDDPGVLISACLFGDGAGAAVLSRAAMERRRPVRWMTGATVMDPARRDLLRFEQRGGLLRNTLAKPVPQVAAQLVHGVFQRVLTQAGVPASAIQEWIWHAGGRDVLLALKERLGLEDAHIARSRAVLRDYGNLSSAFVYFVLQSALRDAAPGGLWWVSSFGAGFSCHGALLEVAG